MSRLPVRTIALWAVLLFPAEAHLSGSSVVTADSEWFSVQLVSPRKIFKEGRGEADWHREWRAENQSKVDGARAKLQPLFPSLAKRYPLSKYRGDHALVEEGREWLAEDSTKSKKPFRYRFKLNEFSVTVVFMALPEAEARAELKAALSRGLSSE